MDAASALHNLSRTSPSCSERGRGSDTFPSLEANDNIPEPQKISNPKWQKRTEEVLAQKNEIDNNSLGEIDYSLSNGKITVYDTSHPTPTSIKYCYSSAGRSGVRFAPVSVATVMNLLNPSLLVDLKVKGGRGVNKETVRAPSLRSSSGSSQLDRDECIQVLFEKVLRAHFIQNGLRKLNTETNVIENGQRNVLSDLNFYPGGIQSKFASNRFSLYFFSLYTKIAVINFFILFLLVFHLIPERKRVCRINLYSHVNINVRQIQQKMQKIAPKEICLFVVDN